MIFKNQNQPNNSLEPLNFKCIANAYEASNATYEKLIYEFDKHYKLEFSFHDNSNDGVITFRLPEDVNPLQIEKIKLIDPGIPKTSWGDLEYYGRNINDEIMQQSTFVTYASNSAACSLSEIAFRGKEFYGINIDTHDGWGAHFKSQQQICFNWFYHAEHYYVQIFYKQYAESWRSVSNGKMWWDLGKGIEIHLF